MRRAVFIPNLIANQIPDGRDAARDNHLQWIKEKPEVLDPK
jgi:hypothetical protein